MKKILMVLFGIYSMTVLADDIALTEQMKAMDSALFETFNHCQNSQELAKHARYFATDVEFYHDNGGVTWDRETLISNTKNNVCGKYTRKLVEGSFKSYPIKDFGAITQGVHIFCQNETLKCEGKADFVMVWRKVDNKWQITRVLSYGHRENK